MRKIVALLCLCLLMPVILIGYVTHLEMQQYEPQIGYSISQLSYGEAVPIERIDIVEKFRLDGVVTSREHIFIDCKNSSHNDVKSLVNAFDEIQEGEIIAYVAGKPLYSPINGIVLEANVSQANGYYKVLYLDNLLFKTSLPAHLAVNIGDKFYLDKEVSLELIFLSNIITDAGREAYFRIQGKDIFYGQHLSFDVPTGVVHTSVLATRREAVYQKNKGGPYYIRRVDANGKVIGEIKVDVGITDGKMISVSGVQEGWYCDLGYGRLRNAELEGAQ